jgi:superfamily I DNA/RNA helicase
MSITKLTTEAQQGNAESQYLLGRAYDEGNIVPRNLLEAISWYQKAANQGHTKACEALGIKSASSGSETSPIANHRVTKIYGPPGTGKTTKLIELIREAIASGVEPDMIGFFSFTNKATEEAKSRMVKEFPQFDIEADFPYFQTIHSLANKALQTRVKVISDRQAKEFDPNVQIERPFMKEGDESSQVVRIKHPVLDAATTARALKRSFKEYLENLPESQRWPINKWLGLPFKRTREPISVRGIEHCIAYNDKYEAYKKGLDVIDFADMLDRAVINKMSIPELRLLLIDEAQDLSPAQWDIADVLISKADKVVIAGDDDQAICESFGASAKHFLDTKGHEVILEVSRRIPVGVHQHLSHLIPSLTDKSPSRKEKVWHPRDDTNHGEVFKFFSTTNFLVFLLSQIKINPQNDILLMFVTNGSLQIFSGRLEKNGISHYAANELVGSGTPNIRLLTIWGAKGGQAHTTALVLESDMDEAMLHEDPRLEYVAHSRAMHSFYYVRPNWRSHWKPNVLQHPADQEQTEQVTPKPAAINLSSTTSNTTSAPQAVEPTNLQNLVNKFSRPKKS